MERWGTVSEGCEVIPHSSNLGFFLAEHLQVDCVRASPHLQVDNPASVKLQSSPGHLAGTQGPVILRMGKEVGRIPGTWLSPLYCALNPSFFSCCMPRA